MQTAHYAALLFATAVALTNSPLLMSFSQPFLDCVFRGLTDPSTMERTVVRRFVGIVSFVGFHWTPINPVAMYQMATEWAAFFTKNLPSRRGATESIVEFFLSQLLSASWTHNVFSMMLALSLSL